MSKSRHVSGVLVVIVVVVLVGWAVWQAQTSSQESQTGPIRIGVSSPLTGEAASFGEGVTSGLSQALAEINNAGGINGRPIQLIMEDDKCNKEGSTTISKLVNFDRVTAIIGPLCSAAAGPGLPIAQREKTPVIFWGSAPHLTKIGDYMFRTYPSDSMQGKFAAEYIFNKLKKKQAAVIYVKNDWGQGIADVFAEQYKALGGKITYFDGFAQDAKDLRTMVVKLKATAPEAVYFPAYPATGIIGIQQMREAGVEAVIVGGDAFADDSVLKAAGAEGVLFTQGVINNPEEFMKKVQTAQGEKATVNWVTPLAYDALNIFAAVMKEVGTDRTAIKDALAKLSYDKGVSIAKVEFDENGDLKEANFEVRVIKRGKSELSK